MRNNQHDNRFVAQYNALGDELASKIHLGEVDADGIHGYLQRGVNINYTDRLHHSLLFYAVRSGVIQNIDALLNRGANPNGSVGLARLPIVCYASFLRLPLPIIDVLLRYGADINRVDEVNHCGALYYAIANGCSREYYNILVDRGARLLFDDSPGLLYLLWNTACVGGKVFVARALLALRYSPDQRFDPLDETPREMARVYQHAELLNLFASYRAEADEGA